MNLLFDLKEILTQDNDHEHSLRVSADPCEVRVELIWSEEDDEKVVLPIVYDACLEFAYIPDKEYRKKYNIDTFGIDKLEAKLAFDIMSYLELHGTEIIALCLSNRIPTKE